MQKHTIKTPTELMDAIMQKSDGGIFKMRKRVAGLTYLASSTVRGIGYFGEGETPTDAIRKLAERMGIPIEAD